jgi:hypothetical protein
MKRFLISAFMALSASFSNVSYATFWADLWYNPNESGWGLNIAQQDQTLFVYGADNRANWYVASNMTVNGSGYLGDLFQTTGPAYFNTFNPNGVGIRKVGRIIFVPKNEGEAGISYEVDGLTINKNIERQTFKAPLLTDTWLGNYRQRTSNCSAGVAGGNGVYNDTLALKINDSTTSRIINGTLTFNASTVCTFSGTRNNLGKIFNILGTYSCPNGGGGQMDIFNGQYLETTISARIQLTNNANRCTTDGAFAGTTSAAP